MNNLLNRLPNIKNYAISDKLYYVSNVLDTNLYSFIVDLKFLVKYWNDLFKCLGFDDYKNIIINELYKKYYENTNQTINSMLLLNVTLHQLIIDKAYPIYIDINNIFQIFKNKFYDIFPFVVFSYTNSFSCLILLTYLCTIPYLPLYPTFIIY